MRKLIIKVSKNDIRNVLLFVLLKLTLDLSYVYLIAPVYTYAGLTVDIDILRIVESYILVAIISFSVKDSVKYPSDFLIWMFAAGTLVPSLSYYAMHSGSREFMYAMVGCFFLVVIFSKLSLVSIPTLKEGRTIGIILLFVLLFIVSFSLIQKGGLSYFNLDFSKVYDFRREVGAVTAYGIWGYLNTWVFKIVNPALIAWALWKQKHKLVILLICLQVLFFGISSSKGVLFFPILILGVYWFVNKKNALIYLSTGIIAIMITSAFLMMYFDNGLLSSLFIRRTMFLPAQLNFAYYELFSQIGHVHLSNSILKIWIHYPFPYEPQQMVSEYVYKSYNAWCNTGFLATGYMHFGYIGMLIFSIITGGLVWMVNCLYQNRMPLWLATSISVVPFFVLFTSSDLLTALLTHGILLCLLILFIFGHKNDVISNRPRRGR